MNIFTTTELPMGDTATVYEGQGKHLFNAMIKANGNTSIVSKYLIIELVQINNQQVTEKQLDEMHIRDISYLMTVISTMMSNDFLNSI